MVDKLPATLSIEEADPVIPKAVKLRLLKLLVPEPLIEDAIPEKVSVEVEPLKVPLLIQFDFTW